MHPIYWHRYPFLFLTIPLILGIITNQYIPPIHPVWMICLISSSFLSLFLIQKRHSGIIFAFISFIGLFSTGLYLSENKSPTFTSGETYLINGRCTQILAPGKIILSSTHLHTYLQLQDTTNITLGDSLSGLVRLYPLLASQNHYDFNYDHYLRNQGAHAKGFPIDQMQKTGHSQDLRSTCHSIQNQLTEKFKQVIPDSTTFQLLAAICLGSRQQIPPDIKTLFQDTGTIHILAISGLHIGAIFLFFSFLLRLLKFNKSTHLLLIPLIWLVAGITGLSPSACRAATILSFITIGKSFKQEIIPLNAIAAAAFFTLLIRPELLYSVSFQMSYAAYTGIILIYPLMRFKSKHKPLTYVYSLFCISFSAQVMTLPIMAYHFHSISLNSILINIIAVPIATLFLYGGIIVLILPAFISVYLSFLIIPLSRLFIFSLKEFSKIVINLPELYPTPIHIALLYSLITLIVIYIISRERNTLKLACACTGILVLYHCLFIHLTQNQQEIIVCNTYKNTSILLNYNGHCTYLKTTSSRDLLTDYITANRLQLLPSHETFIGREIKYSQNRLQLPQSSIAILDKNNNKYDDNDIVIVTENTYPSATSNIHPLKIVIDNSNSSFCVKAWQDFCIKRRIPFFRTDEQGTIILKI